MTQAFDRPVLSNVEGLRPSGPESNGIGSLRSVAGLNPMIGCALGTDSYRIDSLRHPSLASTRWFPACGRSAAPVTLWGRNTETRDDPIRTRRWFQAGEWAAMTAELDAALAAPRLTPFAGLTVQVGAPVEVGAVGHGTRRVIPILGGSCVARDWSARVLPG